MHLRRTSGAGGAFGLHSGIRRAAHKYRGAEHCGASGGHRDCQQVGPGAVRDSDRERLSHKRRPASASQRDSGWRPGSDRSRYRQCRSHRPHRVAFRNQGQGQCLYDGHLRHPYRGHPVLLSRPGVAQRGRQQNHRISADYPDFPRRRRAGDDAAQSYLLRRIFRDGFQGAGGVRADSY